MTNQTGWASLRIWRFFCVSSSFCGSQSKRYSRANGRNRKRWERGHGENGSPHPRRFLFRPCADVRLLAKHIKKRQLSRREVRESRENRRLEGLTEEKGAGSEREMQNAKLLSPFIYFAKSVRILNQKQEPRNITKVKFCALIRQNFTS